MRTALAISVTITATIDMISGWKPKDAASSAAMLEAIA